MLVLSSKNSHSTNFFIHFRKIICSIPKKILYLLPMYLMRRKKTRKSKLSLCMMSEYVLSISMYVPLLTFQKETQTDHTCFPLSCQKAKIFATRWRYNALMPCDLEEIRLKPNKLAMVALCQPQ